jgi:DNA modification methylase
MAKKKKKAAEPEQPVGSTPAGLRVRNAGVITVRVSEILDNPLNFRTHPKAQSAGLAAAVEEIGWFGYPDVFRHPEHPDKFMLVDGELRARHLRKHYGESAEIEVNLTDFNPAEAAKALATKDALSAMAGTEQDTLDELLSGIEPEGEDFEKLLLSIRNDEPTSPGGETLEDGDPVEPSEEIRQKFGVEAGAIFTISGNAEHRLMVADSTDPEAVAALLDGVEPFLMVTDPPYGVDYTPAWREIVGVRREGRVANDDRVDWREAYALFPGRVAYVWHAGRYVGELILSLAGVGLLLKSQIVWRKPYSIISRGHYHWQHEPCLYAARSGSVKWKGGTTESSVWEIDHRNADAEHKGNHGTQKPLECMGRPIRNHGTATDAVYDPFLGSGTTMVAAERLARPSFGMEIDPIYAAVVLERLEQEGCLIERI